MKFKNGVSPELREILLADLERYSREVQMTENEFTELCKWVQDSNSPYDNGWCMSSEDGHPMSFVEAMREIEDMCSEATNEIIRE